MFLIKDFEAKQRKFNYLFLLNTQGVSFLHGKNGFAERSQILAE